MSMRRREHNEIVYYTFNEFDLKNVSNIISTRLGGISPDHLSSLNLSFSPMVGDDPDNVIVNRARFYNILGLQPEHVAQADLVHGKHVAIVDAQTPRETFYKIPATDGLVTNVPNVGLFIPVADCAALTLYDPQAQVIGAIHAGWKGTVAGIIPEAIRQMSTLGSTPSNILAGISPVLEKCCYQVRADLVERVTEAFPGQAPAFFEPQGDDIHYAFDFLQLLCWQLQESGVLTKNISTSGMCTACHVGEFYSHRAEHGRTGRFAALIIMN